MLIVSKPGKLIRVKVFEKTTITLDISKDNQLNTPKVLDGNEVKLAGRMVYKCWRWKSVKKTKPQKPRE